MYKYICYRHRVDDDADEEDGDAVRIFLRAPPPGRVNKWCIRSGVITHGSSLTQIDRIQFLA